LCFIITYRRLFVTSLTLVIVVQEQIEANIYANSYADGGIRDVIFSPDGKHMFATGFDVSLCCFKMRYDATVCIVIVGMNGMIAFCQMYLIVFDLDTKSRI